MDFPPRAASRALSPVTAQLIALVVETFNFATFCVLFIITLWLMFKQRVKMANRLLLPTLSLMWLLSVAHWGIDIARAVQAFVYTAGGPLAYYDNLSNPLEPAKDALYVLLTMAGDLFMIYRCFMVWNRSWLIVIIPALLWCGLGVGGLGSLHYIILAGKQGIFSRGPAPWITTFFATSLALNIFCTITIAYRILRTPAIRNLQSTRIRTALIIFVESAAIYSVSVLALVIVYELGNNVHFILLDLTTSIIGVTFTLVTLRLALVSSASTDSRSHPSTTVGSARVSRHHQSHGSNDNSFPLTAVSTVSRLVEVGPGRGGHRDTTSKPESVLDIFPESSVGKDDAESVYSKEA
ncbi:hypothetical protein C8F01DRAFT_478881 [Mycena amicta]|nr:hypothetical protein C8F01DRAFT_478881 [Mycena amicta]